MSTEADIVEQLLDADMGRSGDAFCVSQEVAAKGAAEITKLRAERDAAARDMRVECAKIAFNWMPRTVGEAESGRRAAIFIFEQINALPDTPAVVATDGKDAT